MTSLPPLVPSNPWFETESGLVEFVVFQERLETIGRWIERLEPVVDEFLAEGRAQFRALVTETSDAETVDVVHSELSWSEQLIPVFSFGLLLPACFGAAEMLCSDLVELFELRGNPAFDGFDGGRGAPAIERRRLYFERVVGLEMDWERQARKQFEILLNVRNKVAHSLGEGLSAQALNELARLMEWTNGQLRFEPMVVEAALQSVGGFARVIEESMIRSGLA